MKYVFHCYGHPNITARHVRTLEFTKDAWLTKRGDCIIGVRADFDKQRLQQLSGKVRITLQVNQLQQVFKAKINPYFNHDHEIVLRKSNYRSPRTLATGIKHGASRLDRRMVQCLQNPQTVMQVTIEEIGQRRTKVLRVKATQEKIIRGDYPRQENVSDGPGYSA